LQRAGGRARALANRTRSAAFRLPQGRRRRRRRWRGALALARRRAVLPFRLGLSLRWVLAHPLFAVPDLGLGQVVHELPDGVPLPSFGDLVQQDVFGVELRPGVHAVEVGQYAVYYARCPWCYLRRSGQLTWPGRWEVWRWSEQTWLWSRGFSAGGLEVVLDGMEFGSLGCECKRSSHSQDGLSLIWQDDGLRKTLRLPISL
jgi:hypothetical protein